MLRLLEYIIFILVAYKILKELLTSHEPQKNMSANEKQHINVMEQQNNPPPQNSKFNSAEPIDYEEVK